MRTGIHPARSQRMARPGAGRVGLLPLGVLPLLLGAALSGALLSEAAASSLPHAAERESTSQRATAEPQSAPATGAVAVVVYRKVFKSSSPEFTEIRVPEQGLGSCDQRSLDEQPDPQPVEIGSALRTRIFALAAELNDFRGITLDVQRRIAYLGEKTFRFERGGESNEVKFNYTLNSKASQLLQIFDGLAREQDEITVLARRMKYDRLGVNDALLQIDDDIRHQVLVQPERFLPLLEQIAGDERFLDIARKRARALADYIRSSAR